LKEIEPRARTLCLNTDTGSCAQIGRVFKTGPISPGNIILPDNVLNRVEIDGLGVNRSSVAECRVCLFFKRGPLLERARRTNMLDGEYVLNNSAKPVEMAPGVWRKTLVTTSAMMLVEIIFDQDAVAPLHSHPNEQIGYVVKGQFELTIFD
jgi:hypothetical protein